MRSAFDQAQFYAKAIVAFLGIAVVFLALWLLPDTANVIVGLVIGVLTAFGVFVVPNRDPSSG